MLEEITSIKEIQDLLVSGFTDWKQYGEVSTKEMGDLVIFNYTAAAQYNDRWNYFECVSRGLIINKKTGEIVARPFDKFFNWLQGGRTSRGHIVSITEKIDGSMITIFKHPVSGLWTCASKGSFTSDQALWANDFLYSNFSQKLLDEIIPPEYTVICELIHPENRIVIDYKGRTDLVLLAMRNKYTGEYVSFFPTVYEVAASLKLAIPDVYTFNDVTKIIEICGGLDADHEGFVAEFSDGQRFKFKGDRYLELHRLISNLTFKNTLKAFAENRHAEVRAQLPDEFVGQFDQWIFEIKTIIDSTTKRIYSVYNNCEIFEDKKSFAIWVMKNHKDISYYLFALYDGKPISRMILEKEFKDRTGEKATVDITTIPTEELEQDLQDSLKDINACEAGLACGLTESCGVSIQYRLDQNRHFVEVITAELERRKKE